MKDRKWLKPILILLEYFATDDISPNEIKINRKLQVEHILPQRKPKKNPQEFTDEERKDSIYKLGNLTLLYGRKNIQASNKSFSEKMEIYQNKDGLRTCFESTQRIYQFYTPWNPDELKNRQNEMIKKINEKLDIF
nr:HNH endonuclease family protein [Campylobacter corcagiensis]